MRDEFNDMLGHIVHARLSLDSLRRGVIMEMRSGEMPTYRGMPLTPDQFRALEGVSYALEAAFAFAKGTQFVETVNARMEEAETFLALADSLSVQKELPNGS